LHGEKSVYEIGSYEFKSQTDSDAFEKAYDMFFFSLGDNVPNPEYEITETILPLKFRLLNENGSDITSIVMFDGRNSLEKNVPKLIEERRNFKVLYEFDDLYQKILNFKKETKPNPLKAKSYEKYFVQSKDEFSKENIVFYEPVLFKKRNEKNRLYCYFSTNNGKACGLRFTLYNFSFEVLDIKNLQFLIDDKLFEYRPQNVNNRFFGNTRLEWMDDLLTHRNKELIYSLANSKSAKLKIQGESLHLERKISQKEIQSICQTLAYYRMLGGKY